MPVHCLRSTALLELDTLMTQFRDNFQEDNSVLLGRCTPDWGTKCGQCDRAYS